MQSCRCLRYRGRLILVMLLMTQAIAISSKAYGLTLQGTVIRNQAAASYQDTSGVQHQVTSNLVQTVIQQVAGIELVQDQLRLGSAGSSVDFPHNLINTGNGVDSYELCLSDQVGDNYDFNTIEIFLDADFDGVADSALAVADLDGDGCSDVGPLAAGESLSVVVKVEVPSTASGNGQISLTAISDFDNALTASNTDTVEVTAGGTIEVTKSISAQRGSSPSGTYTITLAYQNLSNTDVRSLTIADVLPTQAQDSTPGGMTYHSDGANNHAVWTQGSSTLNLTDEDTVVQTSADADVTYCAYDVSCSSGVFGTDRMVIRISDVPAGESGTLTFEVNIDSGLDEGDVLLNRAEFSFLYIVGTDGFVVTGRSSNTVSFVVENTATTPGVVVNTSSVSSSVGVDDSLDADNLVVIPSAAQGASVTFDNVVWNTGDGTDTFDIVVDSNDDRLGAALTNPFPPGTTFQLLHADGFTPLSDTDGNGIPDTGPLVAGALFELKLRADLPLTSQGSNGGLGWEVTLTATSIADSLVNNAVSNRLLNIVSASVDLTNDQAGNAGAGLGPEVTPVTTLSVSPDQSTVFSLWVRNTGSAPDSYNLEYSDSDFIAGQLPNGWSLTFFADGGLGDCSSLSAQLTNTGQVAAGASHLVCAQVSIPIFAIADGTVTALYFRVHSTTTGALDTKHDGLLVTSLPSINLEPNQIGQTDPGGSVTYSHLVENTGNTALECISIETTDSLATSGWVSAVYLDVNANGQIDSADIPYQNQQLSAGNGANFTILVKVFAPATAALGQQNLTTVTANATEDDGDGDPSTCAGTPVTATVIDSTVVNQTDLVITKEQALDSNCDGVPDGPGICAGDVCFTFDRFSARPGQECVIYRLRATNTGVVNALNVVIRDAAPQFTVFNAAGSLPLVSQGNIAGGSANSTGLIEGGAVSGATVTVIPGAVLEMRFGVRVE